MVLGVNNPSLIFFSFRKHRPHDPVVTLQFIQVLKTPTFQPLQGLTSSGSYHVSDDINPSYVWTWVKLIQPIQSCPQPPSVTAPSFPRNFYFLITGLEKKIQIISLMESCKGSLAYLKLPSAILVRTGSILNVYQLSPYKGNYSAVTEQLFIFKLNILRCLGSID